MKPIKALIFGIDDLFLNLKPYYDREVKKGNLEIVGYAVIQNNQIALVKNLIGQPLQSFSFQKIIISSSRNFMTKFKLAKNFFYIKGGDQLSLNDVIDGKIFMIPNFDFSRFCIEGIAYGRAPEQQPLAFCSGYYSTMHPKCFINNSVKVEVGTASYCGATLERNGLVSIGNFSSLSWGLTFSLNLNQNHNHFRVALQSYWSFGWDLPDDYKRHFKQGSKLIFGSDVWVGRGCSFVIANPDKSIRVGNGAIIATNSNVIKDVPPFAIVGGNPAQFIKWRFDRKTIEALERIAWWNWDLERIYDNFRWFYDPVEFVKKFDPQ